MSLSEGGGSIMKADCERETSLREKNDSFSQLFPALNKEVYRPPPHTLTCADNNVGISAAFYASERLCRFSSWVRDWREFKQEESLRLRRIRAGGVERNSEREQQD